MTATSFYCLDCVCGRHLQGETRELVCPKCGRQIRIEWPAKAEEDSSKEEIREIKQPAA